MKGREIKGVWDKKGWKRRMVSLKT